jgi:hypothetical protein
VSAPTWPFVPLTSVAGHFLSMQPAHVTVPPADIQPDKVWYRGDRHVEVYDLMSKYRDALETIVKSFSSGGSDTDQLLAMVEIAEGALK